MDVAVVGGGPAGAWAAYTLARRGARVALFDGSHPREKPCGGGVTGRALTMVGGAIGATLCPATRIDTARFVDSARGRAASVALARDAAEPPLVVVSRAAFDRSLVQAAIDAGATLVDARVTGVAVQPDGVRVDTVRGAHRAAFVVGADGANSLVRRRVAAPFRRDQLSMATGFYAAGVTSREIVLEFCGDPPGYFWSFPRPDHLAIGVCAPADAGVTPGDLRARTASWIRATGLANGAALGRYAWPIPSLAPADFGRLALAGSRWALAGDAAGLVDPLTREGIFFALQSGAWAADAASGEPRRYVDRVHAEIVPELSRAARVQSAFFRPALSRLLIDALLRSESIRAVMADLVAGRQSYATLKRRLLGTCELGLAVRALQARYLAR